MVVLALAAADDLAVSLWCEAVVVQHRARIVGVLLHVEGLRFLWIVVYEHRPIVPRGDDRLFFRAKITSPFDGLTLLPQPGDGIGIRDAREGRLDGFQG